MTIADSNSTSTIHPVTDSNRIATLDVLRGFALLGILVMNIGEFGLLSPNYSNPGFDLNQVSGINLVTWISADLLAEGVMRTLFSILFGAGILLFTTGPKGKSLAIHQRRMMWLLGFGLVDAYLLLWRGDILVNYAICGAILYWARNLSAKTLLILFGIVFLAMSLFNAGLHFLLSESFDAWLVYLQSIDSNAMDINLPEAAQLWDGISKDLSLTTEQAEAEIAQRGGSYFSAFSWNTEKVNNILFFANPAFLIWDAMMMMLLGMAFYKLNILQGLRENSFYIRLSITGFTIGLLTNGYEIISSIQSQFYLLNGFHQAQITYHLGRLGMAMGYIGIIVICVKHGYARRLSNWLAAVGKTALSNYLLQSIIGALLFTGAGFGLVNQFDRTSLYMMMLLIWAFQLWASHKWLHSYQFGPLEWLWRYLTYGKKPAFRR